MYCGALGGTSPTESARRDEKNEKSSLEKSGCLRPLLQVKKPLTNPSGWFIFQNIQNNLIIQINLKKEAR